MSWKKQLMHGEPSLQNSISKPYSRTQGDFWRGETVKQTLLAPRLQASHVFLS
jgi:hypothetical protein